MRISNDAEWATRINAYEIRVVSFWASRFVTFAASVLVEVVVF